MSSLDVLKNIIKFVENTFNYLNDNFKYFISGLYIKIICIKNYFYSKNIFKNSSCLDDFFF